jgi:hypothetical protein
VPRRRSTSPTAATRRPNRFLKTAAAQPDQRLQSTLALADYYSAARRYLEARRARPDDDRPVGRRGRPALRRSSWSQGRPRPRGGCWTAR